MFDLKGVVAKNERGYRLNAIKKALLIAINLTSISCVYKENIVKNDLYQRTVVSIQIQKDATFNSDRKQTNLIPNKSFRYYKQYSSIIF